MLDLDWTDLESHVTADGVFAPPAKRSAGIDAKVVKFPCQPCGGSGSYRGARVHQTKSHCFACGGKGYFLTSERDRRNARVNTAARKERNLAEASLAFDAANPGLVTFLQAATKWSSFAADLYAKLGKYGSLTEGQVRAVRSMQAKTAARQETRQQERAAGAATVDLSPIRAMFDAATRNGSGKEPTYRAAGLIIAAAKAHSANPGALYIRTTEGEYLGKLVGCNYSGRPAPALAQIAADPRGEAIKYGRLTSRCSCCGKLLTNDDSIKLGIGPICAAKWGL